MQIISQSDNPDSDNLQLHKFSATQPKSPQHGKQQSDSVARRPVPLLAIPSESLTHITAFLDTVSLFALGRANKVLHDHITDDNTWHRAFACQFLGERPERPDSQRSNLLRRREGTWKKEFVLRCNIIHRWERCRIGAVSHAPHYSPVTSMYLLSDRSYGPALLTVSLQYGVVSRSFPLIGKVLKGYISASDGFGIGNGNPNAEFTPNLSSCAITTEGWTARAAFGFMSGEVALASSMRVMESGRTEKRVTRCRINEEHRGSVTDIVWDGTAFVTASEDGEVRVWDSKRMRCVYVLEEQQTLTPDPCIHVASDLDRGVILAAKKSGIVAIWVGLSLTDEKVETNVVSAMFRIIPPGSPADETREPSRIFMDRSVRPGLLCYGIHYVGDMHFFRVNVDLVSGQNEAVKFADGPLGPIEVIYPFFESGKDSGRTVIFAGDSLGHLSLFEWPSNTDLHRGEVSSFRGLDVTLDGSGVSAISCNPYILAVGTSRGVTKIYDTLALRLLREFSSPLPRPNASTTPVKEIIIERDLLLVAVGDRVLAWEARPVRPHKPLVIAKRSQAKVRNAKWHKRLELAQDISESRKAVEDANASERRSHERRRTHQAVLASLGLDEHEAFQYALMLSRDEAEQNQTRNEESAFEASLQDFDPISSAPTSRTNSYSESEGNLTTEQSPSLRMISSRSSSQEETGALPLLHTERMEARGLDSIRTGSNISVPPSFEDQEHFPAISSSVSSAASSLPRSSSSSVSASWSARLKASASSGSSSSVVSASTVPVATASFRRSVSGPPPSSSGPSLLSETLRLYGRGEASSSRAVSAPPQRDTDEDMDADLKLAIELSLAEALSVKDA
ncbi:hypothetical protein A7U60_g378 [Sanghuangporus baumii]|uniref:F-box domain-containing protein n=1 Tax=Sanghuangporus baumii TaxID=108892 RepID=A0A9Q5I6K7_SANBA|nr:hypothetical protein A7U60_g378 [Sanghuangporus baumii]